MSSSGFTKPSAKEIRNSIGSIMTLLDKQHTMQAEHFQKTEHPQTVTPCSSQTQHSLTGYPWPAMGESDQIVQQTVREVQRLMKPHRRESGLASMLRARNILEKESRYNSEKEHFLTTVLGESVPSSSSTSSVSRSVVEEEPQSDHEYSHVPYYVRNPALPVHRRKLHGLRR